MTKKKTILLIVFALLLLLIIAAAVIGVDISRDISGKKYQADRTYVLEVKSGDTTRRIAARLSEAGVIDYPRVFVFLASMQNADTKLQVGTYEFHLGEKYDDILFALRQAPNYRPQVTITFREGIEVSDIVALFLENGIGTQAGFDAAMDAEYSCEYLPAPGTEHRLEGFLYPDTYAFFLDDTEVNVFAKMIANFNQKASAAGIAEKAEHRGMTVYEAVTLGSIIEKEGGKITDFAMVSSVFHNRLKIGMLLQSDAAVSYMIPKNERLPSCTAAQLAQDTPYNVYIHPGLTPTPICCCSIDAILAACEPAESNYYYFIGTPSGETIFAETYAQHQANIKKYLK